ncbi:hypothetical protein LZ683_09500 [Comamonas testosteroni]|uniref:hypothetical protein n=1 Tax=Comamonas testosteroni TaxID=285 RepID=UPI0023AA56F4|nr:hypothetical protein [Comamonas testosteroni]WEE79566.1 hypothetical protein LZ683_09500 [Comamonas testosteroni]
MMFLRFENETAAAAALAPWAADSEAWPCYIGSAAVDVVGLLFIEDVAVPGWHINLSERVDELQPYEIAKPSTPDRVFAGSDALTPARVPAKVTRRQARQALAMEGLLGSVQPAIDAIADPLQRQLAQIEWDDSQDFERDRPLLIQLGHAIGLTDAGIDGLFIRAGGL